MAKALYESLGKGQNISYLLHDNYYKDISHLSLDERSKNNFDHPESLDTKLLIEHLKDLKGGKTVEVPNYDFTTHSRTSEVTAIEPKKIILVEGILLFSDPELVEELDIKIYVVSKYCATG